jgi:hypothetical protein
MDFARCRPKEDGNTFVLCDGTIVQKDELRSLFKKAPSDLIKFANLNGITVQVLCKDSKRNHFRSWCVKNEGNAFFKEVTSLHGLYVPNENKIVLHSDAYPGSFIHELLHYRQYMNDRPVFGRVYKAERVKIQNSLVKSMDEIIALVKTLEAQGKIAEAKAWLPLAMELGEQMMAFSIWQKLIDERNLFLLYIDFGKEFGVSVDDVALAKKNINFICADKKMKDILVGGECALK